MNILFAVGKLNIITGNSGSGKSSMLHALLGEMELLHGRIHHPPLHKSHQADDPSEAFRLRDCTAYCAQNPWIQYNTFRANIIYGLPFDAVRYRTILDAVGLRHDLLDMPYGDLTLVGEGGLRLTLGQMHRIALARALYSPAKFILIDDMFSVLDIKMIKHILVNAIKGPAMLGRTCIIATQQLSLTVPLCQFAVRLDHGKVSAQGTPQKLVASGVIAPTMLTQAKEMLRKIGSLPDVDFDETFLANNFSRVPTTEEKQLLELAVKKEHEEEKYSGSASWAAFTTYTNAMGLCRCLLIFCVFAGQQAMSLALGLWIKAWATSSVVVFAGHPGYYLTIHAVVAATCILVFFLRDAVAFTGASTASRDIHRRLLHAVLHVDFSFLDKMPIGQIINRVAKDINTVDQELAVYCMSTLQLFTSVAMAGLIVSITLSLFAAAAIAICLACVAALVAAYTNASRHLKRIAAVERVPMDRHFRETLASSVSIRAHVQGAAVMRQAHQLVDKALRPGMLLSASGEWLALYAGCLASLASSVAAGLVLWNRDSMTAGAAGLILSYALTLPEHVPLLAHLYALSQHSFNAVERIKECLNAEQEYKGPVRCRPPPLWTWPRGGHVRFRGLGTGNSPSLPPLLSDFQLQVDAGCRLAVMGDLGNGETSLALSLIRAVRPSGGYIEIDGVDIASISLNTLRRLVTVIPRQPVLFSGTLRWNLDPLGLHETEEVIEVLQSLGLPKILPNLSLDGALPTLTWAQKQLICIARGMLRHPLVLVLDEATALLNFAADQTVQTAVRDGVTAGTTVITVAQRITTVPDYDRLVLLTTKGRIVEDDAPSRLLDEELQRNKKGVFLKMCKDAGQLAVMQEMASLRRWALFRQYHLTRPRGLWSRDVGGDRILDVQSWGRTEWPFSCEDIL